MYVQYLLIVFNMINFQTLQSFNQLFSKFVIMTTTFIIFYYQYFNFSKSSLGFGPMALKTTYYQY